MGLSMVLCVVQKRGIMPKRKTVRLFAKNQFTIIAGPCAVESREQILAAADGAKKSGADILRAGIWKPRSSPDRWDGLGSKALEWFLEAREKIGIPIATEIRGHQFIEEAIGADLDVYWIGSRNGQSQDLIEAIGEATAKKKTPVILKRAMGADLNEWTGCAGFVTKYNKNVILCERGIRSFPRETRNVLDLQNAWLAKAAGFRVIVDVSHAAGRSDLIIPMARAVKAAGFDGLMVEASGEPKQAKTDSDQQIDFPTLAKLIKQLKKIPLGKGQ